MSQMPTSELLDLIREHSQALTGAPSPEWKMEDVGEAAETFPSDL